MTNKSETEGYLHSRCVDYFIKHGDLVHPAMLAVYGYPSDQILETFFEEQSVNESTPTLKEFAAQIGELYMLDQRVPVPSEGNRLRQLNATEQQIFRRKWFTDVRQVRGFVFRQILAGNPTSDRAEANSHPVISLLSQLEIGISRIPINS